MPTFYEYIIYTIALLRKFDICQMQSLIEILL